MKILLFVVSLMVLTSCGNTSRECLQYQTVCERHCLAGNANGCYSYSERNCNKVCIRY